MRFCKELLLKLESLILLQPSCFSSTPMPSVGMKGRTRVFGTRRLRSGRRSNAEQGKRKHARFVGPDDCIELEDVGGGGGGGSAEDAIECKEIVKHESAQMEIDTKFIEPVTDSSVCDGFNGSNEPRLWGLSYHRKRKRGEPIILEVVDDKRFAKHFVRKKRGKRFKGSKFSRGEDYDRFRVLVLTVESSSDSSSVFAPFLNSVLRYMTRATLNLTQLSAFLQSEPMASVYASCGIHNLLDCIFNQKSGDCEIWSSPSFIPLFSVKFSAAPYCFKYLHSRFYLRLTCPPPLVIYPEKMDIDDDVESDNSWCTPSHSKHCERLTSSSPQKIEPENICTELDQSGRKTRIVFKPSVSTKNIPGRAGKSRSGASSRRVKRRGPLRSRRGQNLSKFSACRSGALVSGRNILTHNTSRRSSIWRSSAGIKAPKFTSESAKNILSSSCSANLLIIETDRCYREDRVTVVLEISPLSSKWCLAVKKGGVTRYSITAQENMKSSSNNRITHALIWTADNGWKMEFVERQDWLTFKKLYRECFERNARIPTTSEIPVPVVNQVLSHSEGNDAPFVQPNLYIAIKDDELSRALVRKTAIYDVDSDDEEWLKKFNNDSVLQDQQQEELSADGFELMIDAFEKGSFCFPEDYSNEKAVDHLLHLGRREVVEAVYGYWMKKRKLKRSPLIRVFQLYQRRAQLIPKQVLRKKRSFKRQASHIGRGKQRTLLQAMAAHQDALEEKKILLEVQEATAAAKRAEDIAVGKRHRAQLLMEKADLVTYRAVRALRMAEAANQVEGAPDAANASNTDLID